MSQLDNRVDAFFRIEPRMRSAPQRPNGESPDAFAAGFDDASGDRRLKDQSGRGVLRLLFDERARGPAAYLFVACKP